VAEVGGLAAVPAPARKFFLAPPLYKIIKILTIFSLLLFLFFFQGGPISFLFPNPFLCHPEPMLIFLKVDLLSFNPPLIFFTCSALAGKEEEKIAEKEESKEKKKRGKG
jgi:hypothetical protein